MTPSTSPGPDSTPVRSLDAITEPAVRAHFDAALADPATLGAVLVGSRAIGWAMPDGDYDAFILVTPDRLRTLAPEQRQVFHFAEGEYPKRLIGDYTYFSEESLETHLASPHDIDHWPWVDAAVLADRTGRLETWRARLAALPEADRNERAIQKFIQLQIAYHYATADDVRGFEVDRQMNLYRAVLAGAHLWFTLRGRWTPPLKWWTREIERLEMRPDTRGILEGAIRNPTIETLTQLRDHLKTDMRYAGIAEVDDFVRAFIERLQPERCEARYRHTYL
jgi:hypothetical protein